jgi:hypothetical protein
MVTSTFGTFMETLKIFVLMRNAIVFCSLLFPVQRYAQFAVPESHQITLNYLWKAKTVTLFKDHFFYGEARNKANTSATMTGLLPNILMVQKIQDFT